MLNEHLTQQSVILLVAIASATSLSGSALACPTIDITASNWKFTPAKISVPVGELTTLRLTSTGGVHGFKSDELGVKDTTIRPDKPVNVVFTPKKPGTYVVHCSIMCGPGHPDMTLTVTVAAK